ncbi:HipA N-terminal domain-containing protein [Salegentibacter sp. F188]|uniref:HipA N-terminal domain-containing protein n=1 Tax=Autumnicola patrickiae TaxID=3075591 RepID=A0ABU3E1T2_9FLAO|nr:HipA N-terminal domain-containing protein [Salegentibacter sp. F188]MDT0689960.1 HipA N-terminal domain-containing protein [Salegentibacter sp. F188]
MRQAKIIIDQSLAGILTENEEAYIFEYDEDYLKSKSPKPVSLTLPLQKESFKSEILFPFFDGLIPEGWLLDIVHKNWKLNPRDRMGLLLATCKDCIGNISVRPL